MNTLPNLDDHELHGVLLNALHCAADKYRDNAKTFRDMAKEYPAMSVTHDGLAEQFDRQAREADALAEKLQEQSAAA